ncbi:MAG: hypothetical protein WDN25_14140 [Acetobacteraceae bacterium]
MALAAAARLSGRRRAALEREAAADLAEHAALRPEGFAVLSGRPMLPPSLAALVQAIGGAAYPPATRSVAPLAAAPRPATLGGVRLMAAGRLGPGLLVVREAAAMAPPVAADAGIVWDGRFRLGADADVPAGATLGALGDDAGAAAAGFAAAGGGAAHAAGGAARLGTSRRSASDLS